MDDDRASNPWLQIPASEYEGHMGPAWANQLGTLGELFGQVYGRVRPRRLVMVGAATGTGLEHIDSRLTERVVAIDVVPEYLDVLRSRFPGLAPVLETVCSPAESCVLETGSFDLVHAGLVLEYIEPAVLVDKVATWLAAEGVFSVVLQCPSTQPAVTPSPYPSIRRLDGFMRLVPPEVVTAAAAYAGLVLVDQRTVPLGSGKRFWVGLYGRRPSGQHESRQVR